MIDNGQLTIDNDFFAGGHSRSGGNLIINCQLSIVLQCVSTLNNIRRGGFQTRPYNNERDSRLRGNDKWKKCGSDSGKERE
jgi:hypothetical protein